MLKEYSLQQRNRPICTFAYWRDKGYLEMNAPYQRGDVWGVKRRRNLIKSILIGIPIPSIIINDRFEAESNVDERYAVIDGKQRLTAILMFVDGELAIPSEWISPGHLLSHNCNLVTFYQATRSFQRGFENSAIACSEGNLKTIEEEIEVFNLVNFGGLAQGEKDYDLL